MHTAKYSTTLSHTSIQLNLHKHMSYTSIIHTCANMAIQHVNQQRNIHAQEGLKIEPTSN